LLQKSERVASTEEFVGLKAGYASVRREAVEVVEAGGGGPRGQGGFAELSEALLKTVDGCAGVGITRGDWAAGAGVAAFKMNIANREADGTALVHAEEVIFPESWDAVDFECGAEPEPEVVDGERGMPFTIRRTTPFSALSREELAFSCKPGGDRLKGCGGDDSGSGGKGVVGEAVHGIADDDSLLEEYAEPLGGFLVSFGESERTSRNFATIAGNGEGYGADVRGIAGADQMDGGSALAVDPFAIGRIEGPGAIVDQPAGGRDAGYRDLDGVERLDWVETDVGKFGRGVGHRTKTIKQQKLDVR
jgi:hypothetical protein